MLQVRQRQARPALRPGDRRRQRPRRSRPSFRCSASALDAGRQGARHQRQGRRPTSSRASSSTNWPRSSSATAARAGLGQGRGGQVHRRHREVPARRRSSRALRQRLDAEAGRPAAVRRRQGGRRLPGAGQSAARTWPALLKLYDPNEARLTRSPGWSTSRRSSGTTRRSAGRRTITRSPRRWTRTSPSSRATPAACGPRRTTWSSTATSAAAAASVSTTRRCSRACSRVLGMTDGAGAGSASASCSTR